VVSLSDDGTIVATGGALNDAVAYRSGHLRMFQYLSGSWTQIGNDIDGEAADDQFGRDMTLSGDGTIVVSGDWHGDNARARVFQWINNGWSQVGADVEVYEAGGSTFPNARGWKMSSDGSTIAIGSYDDGSGGNAGLVQIYTLECDAGWKGAGCSTEAAQLRIKGSDASIVLGRTNLATLGRVGDALVTQDIKAMGVTAAGVTVQGQDILALIHILEARIAALEQQ
jgi:hypothetical protein